ncbi:MAG TPA: acyl-CoA dehydrogenase family protein [Candidatus Binataceae bacterium]|nr:acyl-CoA dehydrogenase family protein [Candidatus Binataceae bacterium]
MKPYREVWPDFPQEYEALRHDCREFAQNILRPASLALDSVLDAEEACETNSPLRQVLEAAYRLGYHKASVSRQFGGMDLDGLGLHVLLEELGWGSAGIAMSVVVSSVPFMALIRGENPTLIEHFVAPFVADRQASWIGCMALTEALHGSDSFALGSREFRYPSSAPEVTARSEGDHYVINGNKALWVSNGTIATHALVSVVLSPSKHWSNRAFVFIPLDLPGVSHQGALNKLGQRDLNQGPVSFEQVRIPNDFVLAGEGYELELAGLVSYTSSCMAAVFTGLARAAYEEALSYSQHRIQGGKAISGHQLVQKHLFDMFVKVEACRALSRNALSYHQRSKVPSLEYAIAAKTFCTQAAFEVANDALQLFGAKGIAQGCLIEKLFRDARLSLIEKGANDVLALVGAAEILQHAQGGSRREW